MTTVVAVPVIAPPQDTLEQLERYDREVLLIDNTGDRAYARWYRDDVRFDIIAPGVNLGVARSWNAALARRADLTVIASSSVTFTGGLQAAVERLEGAANHYGCLSEIGMHLHAWRREATRRVGWFDAHFYPGWFEDTDWLRRCDLAGVHGHQGALPKVDVDATTEYGRTKLRLDQEGGWDHAIQLRYYCAKWGGRPHEERFAHPFDLRHRDWRYWPPAPSPERQRQQHQHGSAAWVPPAHQ